MLDSSLAAEIASAEDTADDDEIFCAGCGHGITRTRWAISRNADHEHTVFNPAGQVYCIRVFAEAPGAAPQGRPSGEFTWFKGHQWRIALCAGCAVHIGWAFTGPGDAFFGLIKSALSTAKA